MSTLLLAQDTWDLVQDAAGNIAMADAPYAEAQDVASACRLFAGELWFDTAQGVPYFAAILGKPVNVEFIKAQLEAAALTVPNIVSARCILARFADRVLTGQIQVIDATGASNNVNF